jgi:hypothetical protein
MANPYGIEQVDIPGVLAAYDTARQRRVQAMLTERQIKREDAQLEREHNMLSIMAKVRGPGSAPNAAITASASQSPIAPATAPPDAAVASTGSAPAPAPVVALAAPTVPSSAPAATPQSWIEQNQDVIRQLVAVDPDTAFKLSTSLQQMDDAQLKRVQQHNTAVATAAHHLRSLPLEQRAAERDRLAPDLVAQGVNQQEIARADMSDHGLDWLIDRGRDFEKVLEASKPVAVPEGTQFRNPETGALIAENPKPKHYTTFEVHNADGTTTPYGFDPETHQTFTLSADGTPSGPSLSAGVGMSPAAASVASALSSAGLPAPVVAGFMGNFHVEGGYDGAQGDGGSASGIGQWHTDRAATFQRIIGKPVTQATPAEQAKFVVWEMQNPQAAGMTVAQRDKILAAKTPAEAAALIDQHYERSSGRDRRTRMAAATAFAGGSAPAGGGTQITGRPLPANAGDDDTTKFIGGQVALGQPMPPLGMGKEAAAMRRAILAEATKQWRAMGISPGEANVIAAQNKSGLAELARIASIKANVLTAENTATRNAEQVISLLGSTGSTGSPIFNAWQQAGRRATGDAKVSAFDVAVKTLATEYARVMSGGGNSPLSDAARHEADALIHTSMTADQFRAAIRQMKIDMANRSAGIEQERQATLDQIRTGGRGAPSAAPSPAGIPTLSPEQARSAPKGTVFRTTDGRTMRKQ